MVNGGISVLQSFGVIQAIAGTGEDVQVDFIGDDDLNEIAGIDNLQEIAGNGDGDWGDDIGLFDEGTMSGSSDMAILAGDDEDGGDY